MLAISHGRRVGRVDKVAVMATKRKPSQRGATGEVGHFLGPWMEDTKTKVTRLAGHLNVDKSTVSKWVSGEREPTIDDLRRAAAYMEIDFTALFYHPTDTSVRAQAARMDEDALGVVLRKLGR